MTKEEEELDEYACRAFNPDNHIRVELPSGGWARVSPDCSPETLALLDRMVSLVQAQYEREQEKWPKYKRP